LANYTPTITISDPWVSTSINLSQLEDFATSTEDLLVMSVTAHRLRSENNPNNNWKWIFCVCQLFAFKTRLYMLPDEDEVGAHARGICGLYIQDLKE
jgi:hypothetical protein